MFIRGRGLPTCIALAALLLHGPARAQSAAPMVLYAWQADTSPYSDLNLGGVGDIDGDGLPDVAVGDGFSSYDGLTQNGSVKLRSGRDGSLLLEFHGKVAKAHFGATLAPAGDVDHDGVPDLLVNGKGFDLATLTETTAHVYSGQDGTLLLEIPSDPTIGFVAGALCGGRDFDGDGTPDAVIGAPGAHPLGSSSGAVRVYSGATHQILYEFDGSSTYELLGTAVAAVDYDADGHVDIVVGDPYAPMPSGNIGCARVFSGLDGSLLTSLEAPSKQPPYPSYGAGTVLFTPGDLDHDGVGDVGMLVDVQIENYVRIFAGSTGASIVDAGYGGQYFWIADADGVGDVTGDGTPDLVIGNNSSDVPSLVSVYSGADGSLLAGYFGDHLCAGLGDVDGDGFPDLGVGPRVVSGAPSHWKALGYGSAVFGYSAPELNAYATLVPDAPTKITLRFAKPGTLAWLIVGASEVAQPFKNFELFASPDAVLGPFAVDAAGEVNLLGHWPAGLPSGAELVFQFLGTQGPAPPLVFATGGMAATQP